MSNNRRFALDEKRYIIDAVNPANSGKGYCHEGDPEDDRHLRDRILIVRLSKTLDKLLWPTDSIFFAIYVAIKASHLNSFDPVMSIQHAFGGTLKRNREGAQHFTSLSLFRDDVERLLRDLYGDIDSEALDRVLRAVFSIVQEFAEFVRPDLCKEHSDAVDLDYILGIGVSEESSISGWQWRCGIGHAAAAIVAIRHRDDGLPSQWAGGCLPIIGSPNFSCGSGHRRQSLAADGCCSANHACHRRPKSDILIPAGSGLFWRFPGLFRFLSNSMAFGLSMLVANALVETYGGGEARGKPARGRPPTPGWWNRAVQPHARNDSRIGLSDGTNPGAKEGRLSMETVAEIQPDTDAVQQPRGADAVVLPRQTRTRQGRARLLTLDHLDQRTAAAKAARNLVTHLTSDLGGDDQLSAGERELVKRAALCGAIVADFEARWVAGQLECTLWDGQV